MGKRKNVGIKEHDTKKVKGTKNYKKQKKNVRSKLTEEIADCQAKSDEIPKKIVFDDDGTPSIRQKSQINSTLSTNEKRSKTKSTSSKNKKIIVGDEDDEHQEVPVNNTKDKNNKKNKQIIQNEGEVKDEDIDKFCDELEEEDNKEYENWVKLIEAKLGSNKKES